MLPAYHYTINQNYQKCTSKLKTSKLWLYFVKCSQYSVRSKRSVICAQAVYFLHSTRPSVT